jgi:hypothetical protein
VRTNIALAGLGTLTAFLVATNPVVADAARTVTGKDIKNNSVTGKDVKDGSLQGADVKDESLQGADVKGGALGGAQIQDGSLTGADIAESSLDKVPNAASADQVKDGGVTALALANGAVTGRSLGLTTSVEAEVIVPGSQSKSTVAICPAGSRVIGGGTFWTNITLNDATSADLHLVYYRNASNGVQARGFNGTTDNDVTLVVSAMCLS